MKLAHITPLLNGWACLSSFMWMLFCVLGASWSGHFDLTSVIMLLIAGSVWLPPSYAGRTIIGSIVFGVPPIIAASVILYFHLEEGTLAFLPWILGLYARAAAIFIKRKEIKHFQQAGPAYPPQGVGSADP